MEWIAIIGAYTVGTLVGVWTGYEAKKVNIKNKTPISDEIEKIHAIHMKLSAKEGATGRPEELLDVLGIAFEGTRIERTRIIFKQTKV